MKKFTLAELEKMETISKRQFDDLKLDNDHVRVWLSDMTQGDGGAEHNNEVTVEIPNQETYNWEILGKYLANTKQNEINHGVFLNI